MTSAVRRGLLLAIVAATSTAVTLCGALVEPAAAASAGRVSRCGTALCVDGRQWRLHMGSVNGTNAAADSVSRARDLTLNTLRLTDFLDVSSAQPTAAYNETRWRKVDANLAAARTAGLRVELDLSTYRNLLWAAGLNAYAYDWASFLSFVASRVNTVNGVAYKADPTLALVAFAGEVEPVNTPANTRGVTTGQLTEFYRRVFTQWGSLAPGVLRTTGGLLQLDWSSGIDWRAIFSLPGSDVAAVHSYSDSDLEVSIPAVAAWAALAGKPWIDEEFGYPASLGDRERARRFTDVYRLVADLGAAGSGFWNVGPQTTNTFDVGPQTPRTAAVVRTYAP